MSRKSRAARAAGDAAAAAAGGSAGRGSARVGSAAAPPQYTKVATAVLTNAGRILLVRRSGRMRTMPGLWSCVSGVVEGAEAAVDRALTEIREETGMRAGDVSLLRPGAALLVDDPAGGSRPRAGWEVHPFLFEAKSRRVELNWENSAYAWARRAELGRYRTVARLGEVIDGMMGAP